MSKIPKVGKAVKEHRANTQRWCTHPDGYIWRGNTCRWCGATKPSQKQKKIVAQVLGNGTSATWTQGDTLLRLVRYHSSGEDIICLTPAMWLELEQFANRIGWSYEAMTSWKKESPKWSRPCHDFR